MKLAKLIMIPRWVGIVQLSRKYVLTATTAQIPWTLIIAVAVESTTNCQLVVYDIKGVMNNNCDHVCETCPQCNVGCQCGRISKTVVDGMEKPQHCDCVTHQA